MSRDHWFLPRTPNVLGRLREQLAVTIEGIDACVTWAEGDPDAAGTVRDAERRADGIKRALLGELRAAFVTPLEPEDVFALSQGIDWILNYAGDLISESEVMMCAPDAVIASMLRLLGEAARQIDRALAQVGADQEAATRAADQAIDSERALEGIYYDGMAALLTVQDRNERITRRELYRRCARIGEVTTDVAERVVYAVVKEL